MDPLLLASSLVHSSLIPLKFWPWEDKFSTKLLPQLPISNNSGKSWTRRASSALSLLEFYQPCFVIASWLSVFSQQSTDSLRPQSPSSTLSEAFCCRIPSRWPVFTFKHRKPITISVKHSKWCAAFTPSRDSEVSTEEQFQGQSLSSLL